MTDKELGDEFTSIVADGAELTMVRVFDAPRELVEVIPPERFVRTGVPGPAGPPAVETVTFEDLGGRTKMVYHVRFPSDEVLAVALSEGMTKGVLEQFHRLADLLTELAH